MANKRSPLEMARAAAANASLSPAAAAKLRQRVGDLAEELNREVLRHGVILAQTLGQERTETFIGNALGLRKELCLRGRFERVRCPECAACFSHGPEREDETPEG